MEWAVVFRGNITLAMKKLPYLPNRTLVFALGLAVMAGCVTKKPAPPNYVIFPPPPDEPRIQYLMSFGSESDLAGRSKFTEFLAGEEQVLRPITKPYGVAIRNGKVYVCDTQSALVAVADMNKGKLHPLKPPGQAAMKVPINVAVDENEVCYVTDAGRNQVLIYDKDGNLLEALGKKGELQPSGIAISGDRLYVSDMLNHCVHVYNKNSRQLLFNVPKKPETNSIPYGPTNLAVDRNGKIYVSDSRGFDVKIYDGDGNFIRSVGELGPVPGTFSLPKGVGVDHEGRFYVVDAVAPVVQLFDDKGRLLMWFGEPKSSGEGSLYLPAALTVDYDNLGLFEKYVMPGYKLDYVILLTNQVGPHKVSVYGFLKKA